MVRNMYDKKEYNKKYYQEHREKHDETTKKWTINHPDYQKDYYAKHREKESADISLYQHQHPKEVQASHREWHHTRRLKVFELLGGKCCHCEEISVFCLQIDHINGGGTKHFKSRGTIGLLSDVLADSDRKSKYQLLCANCNWVKRWASKEIRMTKKETDYKKLRREILMLLGNKCVRCGESDWRCLQIDHVNGGGQKEHKEIQTSGILYKIRNDPESRKDYQLLCANCNWKKRYELKEHNDHNRMWEFRKP